MIDIGEGGPGGDSGEANIDMAETDLVIPFLPRPVNFCTNRLLDHSPSN